MKYKYPVFGLFLFAMFNISCSKELHTTKQTAKGKKEIYAISKKVFEQFDQESFFIPKDLDSLGLSKYEIRILSRKIKCPYIHVIYNDRTPRFLSTDSVVLFTRTGFPILGKQHNIVVDMRQTKRDSILVTRSYLKYYKITDGIYYIQDYMPGF